MSDIAAPLWFGPADERLFGWLHVPSKGKVAAAVILCPPLGYEYICAYHAYRVLATSLVAAGLTVLRFDYHGTGDSTGSEALPDRVGAWLRSILAARAELASRTDAPISAVGMRAGALLAATAATVEPFDRLVLWDPAPSGRAFIKELQLLRMVGMGVPEERRSDGSFESAGIDYTAETVTALKELDLAKLSGPMADAALLLTREGRDLAPRPAAVLAAGCGRVDTAPALGQEELIGVVSAHSQVPTASVEAISAWLAADRDDTRHDVRADTTTTAVVGHGPDGTAIVETARWMGEHQLFAITTEPEGGGTGPWLVGLNNSTDHHIGPIRLWVDLAREVAAHGRRFVRMDLSGIGDSGVRPGQKEHIAYASQHLEDVTIAAADLSPDDPHDVDLVGLCSGAYLGVDVGALFGVRSVYGVNPVLAFKPEDLLSLEGLASRVAKPPKWWMRPFSGSDLTKKVGRVLPPWAWAALDRLNLHESPARGLKAMVGRGVDTVLVYGDDDALTVLRQRARHDLDELERSPHFRLMSIDGMDHALMLTKQRGQLRRTLIDLMTAPTPGTDA